METRIYKIDDCTVCHDKICQAAEIIRQEELVAFPTETVYGLGADAKNPKAAAKIYAAKGRPSDNPLIVHIAGFEDLFQIVETLPEQAKVQELAKMTGNV